jgi:hypothetical protein
MQSMGSDVILLLVVLHGVDLIHGRRWAVCGCRPSSLGYAMISF